MYYLEVLSNLIGTDNTNGVETSYRENNRLEDKQSSGNNPFKRENCHNTITPHLPLMI